MLAPLPLAEPYARFRDAVWDGVAEPTRLPGFAEPLSELEIQSLWFAGAFGQQFTGTEGESVRVVDFGVWNSGAGPDFTGCTVTVHGETRHGDIELDPDVRDWERHGHGGNPDYNGVVLHVFLTRPEERFFTRSQQHRRVPQVQLEPGALEAGVRPDLGLPAARLGRCAAPLRGMPAERVASLLEHAAQFRLQRKAARLARSVAAQGREQAVYQALAQALGYRHNQRSFMILAQRLPVRELRRQKPAEREARLFGAAGFLEGVRYEDTRGEARHYLHQLWSEWWKLRERCARWLDPRHHPVWRTAGTRPGNHPQRRLGALAAMLQHWPQVSAPLLEADRWSLAGWRDRLQGLQHPYWSRHYTLMAPAARRPMALVGGSRVQELLANVAYPLLLPERTRLWAEYLELPAGLDNQKVRRACLRLFGDPELGRAFQQRLHQQQGLLQIYEDFCLEDDSACAACTFPERLRDWSAG